MNTWPEGEHQMKQRKAMVFPGLRAFKRTSSALHGSFLAVSQKLAQRPANGCPVRDLRRYKLTGVAMWLGIILHEKLLT
ncbi:hypothetical protein BU26DRAFT_517816 [Trematosphaeria pertusa]|uniref:Uncharacterized protein n=1 Tax=Trematosphaeria pertusa TaxID=390896 RepID=A0A6A6IL22_9PLEO|nr:uncharacterized protein BU26DRAFT_517816 [Trematosphaeria pertusa]KAF2251086.1 hypothetical protein BU26DRAFT_517816 [Trematosphaeria pertusa]